MSSGSSCGARGSADDPTPAGFACSSKTQTPPRLFFCSLGTRSRHPMRSPRCGPLGSAGTLPTILVTFYLRHWAHSNRCAQQVSETTSHRQSWDVLVLNPHSQGPDLFPILIPVGFNPTIHLFNAVCLSL